MFFETPECERRFCERLTDISSVAESSVQLSRQLIRGGLHLLREEFGGLLPDEYHQLDPDLELLEVELLRERLGSWVMLNLGESRRIGYRSPHIDLLLRGAGVTRDELQNLSRPEEVDRKIDGVATLRRYRRHQMDRWRSTLQRAVVDEEKQREFLALNLVADENAKRSLARAKGFMSAQLTAAGYKKEARSYGGVTPVYSNAHRSRKGAALEILVEVHSTPLSTFPVSISVRFMPIFEIGSATEVFMQRIARGDFFKAVEPIVPNFGLYRIAWNSRQVELAMYAYELMLRSLIPLLEVGAGLAACADAKAIGVRES